MILHRYKFSGKVLCFAAGAVALAVAGGIFAGSMMTDAAAPDADGAVVRVVDGDTVDVSLRGRRARVRLIGVDTPETKHPTKPKECFGEIASEQTTKLLAGKPVFLLRDRLTNDTDQYGRMLRYVFLKDGTFVNAALVRDGYGYAYMYQPFVFLKLFSALERDARQNGRGLWNRTSGCGAYNR